MPELVTVNVPLRAAKAGDQINFKNDDPEQFATIVEFTKKEKWGYLRTDKARAEKPTAYKLDRMVWIQRMQATAEERRAQFYAATRMHVDQFTRRTLLDMEEAGKAIADGLTKGLGLQPGQVETRYRTERMYSYASDLRYELDGRREQDINLSDDEFLKKVLTRLQDRLTQEAIRDLRADGGSICYRAQQKAFNEALSEMIRRVERWVTQLEMADEQA